mmetsp:Transcript_6968/g.12885  ORF Transcript_6968/g.12885 Transcript_6968/m.12885 type:complete len:204 (-) Transcript_6968:328-939(-)
MKKTERIFASTESQQELITLFNHVPLCNRTSNTTKNTLWRFRKQLGAIHFYLLHKVCTTCFNNQSRCDRLRNCGISEGKLVLGSNLETRVVFTNHIASPVGLDRKRKLLLLLSRRIFFNSSPFRLLFYVFVGRATLFYARPLGGLTINTLYRRTVYRSFLANLVPVCSWFHHWAIKSLPNLRFYCPLVSLNRLPWSRGCTAVL